jgi:hypothetical protein
MAIFNSYVKLPEGNHIPKIHGLKLAVFSHPSGRPCRCVRSGPRSDFAGSWQPPLPVGDQYWGPQKQICFIETAINPQI